MAKSKKKKKGGSPGNRENIKKSNKRIQSVEKFVKELKDKFNI